ncbi:Gp138 family membrane-puncturing spike protein [Klebsiella pneumoniae]|uniref:Gp138 family membrane-puncturing spike protein n=1 Tax=Klebsiella pneumoniae TaxID=573 RepID=UPI001F4ACE62|nr:Gp138 family membrane-puncturing spike protein [Klebsiella pneumoniae]
MSSSYSNNAEGNRRPNSNSNEFSTLNFVMRQYMAGVRTAVPVIVRGVYIVDDLAEAGRVDVEPLVSQVDGSGNIVPHGVIYDIPYLRLQGGANGIIIDPEAGDIGLAVIADRDVTGVKATKDVSAPGSSRRSHLSDGFYLGGFMNAAPSQYIQFSSSGINIVSPKAITLNAPEINLNARSAVNISAPQIGLDGAVTQGKGNNGGDANFGGSVTAEKEVTGNGIKLSSHGHDGVEKGKDTSGKPENI